MLPVKNSQGIYFPCVVSEVNTGHAVVHKCSQCCCCFIWLLFLDWFLSAVLHLDIILILALNNKQIFPKKESNFKSQSSLYFFRSIYRKQLGVTGGPQFWDPWFKWPFMLHRLMVLTPLRRFVEKKSYTFILIKNHLW